MLKVFAKKKVCAGKIFAGLPARFKSTPICLANSKTPRTPEKEIAQRANVIKLSPGQARAGPKPANPCPFSKPGGVSFLASARKTTEKGHPRPPQTR